MNNQKVWVKHDQNKDPQQIQGEDSTNRLCGRPSLLVRLARQFALPFRCGGVFRAASEQFCWAKPCMKRLPWYLGIFLELRHSGLGAHPHAGDFLPQLVPPAKKVKGLG